MSTAGATAATSTTAGNNYVVTPVRGDCEILGYSPDGRLAGAIYPVLESEPVYAASITAPLQRLTRPPGQGSVAARVVNRLGAIAGDILNSVDDSITPVFWSSATATPTLLTLPPRVTSLEVDSINKHNEMIAIATGGDVYYYASPDAAPIKIFHGPSGYADAFIGDNGTIVAQDTLSAILNVYVTPTSAPIRLKDPTGAYAAEANAISPDGTIVGSQDPSAFSYKACYWLPTDYTTAKYFKAPAGAVNPIAESINSSGQVCGEYGDASNNSHACFWPTLTSEPVDLLSAGGVTVSAINYMTYMFDDGSMIGLKYHSGSVGDPYHLVPKAK